VEIDKVRGYLASHPFARGLTYAQLETIAEGAQTVKIPAGGYLFRKDEPAGKFYIIRNGRVTLSTDCPSRGRIPIQILEPGDVLGWSWLVPPHFWRVDARAVVPVDVIVFKADRLRELLTSDHELGFELMARFLGVVVDRLQATRWHLIDKYEGTVRESRVGVA
jgi:CRP/FNR family cyclic AMP-dependent transcriptional regulator